LNVRSAISPSPVTGNLSDMELFISLKSTANIEIETAVKNNEPEMARRAAHDIDAGKMVLESWVISSGGEMVTSQGTEAQAKIPADHLEELPDVIQRLEETTDSRVSCGVGFDLHESGTALKVAEHRGGKPAIVLFDESVAQEAHELDESQEESELGPITPKDEEALEGDAPEEDGGVEPTLNKAEGDAKPGEATKIEQGSIDPMAAEPSAPSPMSPASLASPSEMGPGGEPQQDPNQLRQAVAAVLQDVKANMQSIQDLQQKDPKAFESVIGLIQAFVAVAQKAFGDQGGPPMQKAEPGALKPMTPGKKHKVVLPVGSQLDTGSSGTRNAGKVKIRHADGSSGWVSTRAGKITSMDGHAVSSRNPSGK